MAVKLTGAADFSMRLTLATLSGKAVVIRDIRDQSERPGIDEGEASLLKLLDKLCNGLKVRSGKAEVPSSSSF